MMVCVDLSSTKESLGWYEFVAPIMEIVRGHDKACSSVHYSECDEGYVCEAEGIILCGTALCDNAFTHQKEAFEWLHSPHCPVLGVCAGLQAMILAFGGSLEEKPEIGMTAIRSLSEEGLIDRSEFMAYELHRYAPRPTEDFIVLAKSGSCVQAVKHRFMPYYGVMFHPEVRNEWIVENFLAVCDRYLAQSPQ